MHKLIGGITEETAGQRTHHEGGYSAVEQQLAEAQRTLARLYLRQCNHCRDYHKQSVAHIRHHKPVE